MTLNQVGFEFHSPKKSRNRSAWRVDIPTRSIAGRSSRIPPSRKSENVKFLVAWVPASLLLAKTGF
ncbi:MAG: hypothetical protein DMG97_36670 [Acidobacteria bacterium]|nr:MAG: hypothetical protein DMG97_36670 [Acidobacteriota bacterium]